MGGPTSADSMGSKGVGFIYYEPMNHAKEHTMSDRPVPTSFDFSDLSEIRIPVTGPPPAKLSCVLCEADAKSAAIFKNKRAACTTYQAGSLHTIRGAGSLELELVSLCLFRAKPDNPDFPHAPLEPDKGKPVGRNTLEGWPEQTIKKLYDAALEISEIDDDSDLNNLKQQRDKLNELISKLEDEDQAKNELDSTEIGSS